MHKTKGNNKEIKMCHYKIQLHINERSNGENGRLKSYKTCGK